MFQLGTANLIEGRCLGGAVTGAAGGAERVAEDGDGVGVVTADEKVTGEDRGQPGGVAGPAAGGCLPGDVDERGSLGIQPGPAATASVTDGRGVSGTGIRGRRPDSAGNSVSIAAAAVAR